MRTNRPDPHARRLEARLQPIKLPPYIESAKPWIGEARLGLNVEDASRPEIGLLRRQGAGKQRNAVGEAGFERLAKNRKTFRRLLTPIDPELDIGMLAADMDLAETAPARQRASAAGLGLGARFQPPCGMVSSASGLKV